MKPLRITLGALALGCAMTAASPADGAWNNVFQVTCWGCRKQAAANYYAAPPVVAGYYAPPVVAAYPPAYIAGSSPGCCDPCPPTCTTKYVQRCYYQPVTVMQTQSYYEAVTTYKTSYYYEPCTSYRYSSYYDPCTCSCQQVATPVTSYKLRAQSCPVQSWVQRCAQVPITSYQKSFYWEPQTTCCSPCSSPCGSPCAGAPAAAPPMVGGAPGSTPPPPIVDGKGSGTGPNSDQYYKQDLKYYGEPPTGTPQSQYRQLAPNGQPAKPAQVNPAPVNPGPGVKLDKIALGGDSVEGKVVSDKNAPRGGVQLTFVSVQKNSADKIVTSNAAGQFQVQLPAGGWLVYMRAADGQYVFHSRIDVQPQQKTPMILVSR